MVQGGIERKKGPMLMGGHRVPEKISKTNVFQEEGR